ncbi:MAG: hypothetical protein H6600_01095 [Flavobacteriales bacterium]|nr:hypothetical protein [Flavobacteriales bacterium]MCB9197033.1 hypothetical protein [Flavobacteriales bacterium]
MKKTLFICAMIAGVISASAQSSGTVVTTQPTKTESKGNMSKDAEIKVVHVQPTLKKVEAVKPVRVRKEEVIEQETNQK